ncbi:MAG: hypothetical protein CM15mP120_09690 [Pseudomonadota bacterium]|nr:MAG: hypothetical protein CM15mP120_09690 [Pseudomonadota bacterium]
MANRRPQLPIYYRRPQGAEAVIAGSCAQATLDQLDEFSLHHPVFGIDLMASNEAIRKDLSAWITANVVNGPVALATSGDVETVKKPSQNLA